MRRLEAEAWAGLTDKSRAPHAPARKAWLSLMIKVSHLQKRPPDAGRCRMGSWLARPESAERTGGRVMALHQQSYEAIPPVRPPRRQAGPGPAS